MALDHVYMHSGMSKRREFGWAIHFLQTWEKLQQLEVVFLVKVHVGSVLVSIRQPSMQKSIRTTRLSEKIKFNAMHTNAWLPSEQEAILPHMAAFGP